MNIPLNSFKRAVFCLVACFACIVTMVSGANPEQRFTLYGYTDVPTFPLTTDLVWPSNVGAFDVCLWDDDKYAAFTITIDDNIQPDHAWWLQMAQTYGLKLTWVVVTSGISGTNSFNGTWEEFQAIVDAGHSVQSHTVSHGNLDYLTDYRDSQIAINTNLSGSPAWTLAYPNPSGVTPDQDLASQYYIGARGTTGTPNKANAFNYMNTNSTSARIGPDYFNSILYGTSGINWLNNNQYRRGWLCTHFHTVQDKVATEGELQYIAAMDDSLVWHALYVDLMKFVQERNTATVTVNSVTSSEIRFGLTDWMDDTIYDYPLTIKFRVSNDWTDVIAMQNGAAVSSWTVTNGGNRYALVKAVPDAGEVVLAKNTGGNLSPVANAGSDLTVTDSDQSGAENVQLDGSASLDPDGSIVAYSWVRNGSVISTQAVETISIPVGTHSITLTVTDDASAQSMDTVVVTVNAGGGTSDVEPPSVPAGLMASNIGTTSVDLDWNVSSDNVGVTGYYAYVNGVNPIDLSGNSVTVAGLSPSTTYAFSVSAYDAAANESAQSAAVNVTTQSTGSNLIYEDFSVTAGSFDPVSGGNWALSAGRYALTNPAAAATPGLLQNISVHDTVVSGDFQLSASVEIMGTTSAWNDATVLFGYQDTSNYYYLSLNESNDAYTKGLIKVENGAVSELADIGVSVVSDIEYPVEIQRSGSSIIALVNGSQVASAIDATFTSGKIGFGSLNDGAFFDNLIVTTSSGSDDIEAPSTPTGLSLSNLMSSSVDLSWSPATDNVGVTGYLLYTNGANPVSVSGTNTTISDLSVGMSYSFTLTAVDAAGNESGPSVAANLVRVTGVNVSPVTLTLSLSGVSGLTETVSPSTAFDTGVSWSSSNTGVATVSSSGVVSAVAAGTAVITVTSDDGGFTDTCVVTVSGAPSVRNVTVTADTDDREIYDTGGAKWDGQVDMRIGGSSATTDSCAVFPFELPVLAPGEVITGADFRIYLDSISSNPAGEVDLYGLPYRSTSPVDIVNDYYEGSFGSDTSATALDNAFATLSSPTGTLLSTDSTGASNLVDYLNAQYAAGASGGDFVFLRLNPSVVDVSSYNRWNFLSANTSVSSERPVLALEISGGSSADVTAPSVPSGLSASNITESSVDLSWSGSTDNVGVTGYLVYTDGANPVSVSGTNTTISGLSANTTYSFTVSAFDGAGNQSAQSGVLNVTTSASPDIQAPSVPTGLSVSNLTTSTVDLSWSGSTDNVGVTGYKVYIDGGSPVNVSGTSATISGLSIGISYSFTVSAVDAAGNESSPSVAANLVRVTGVNVSPVTLTLSLSGVSGLTETVSPSTAFDTGVSWSSSNTGVATVSSSGVVSAVAAGTAVITVTSDDGGFTDTCVVTVSGAPSVRNVTVTADTDDMEIYDNGGAKWVGQSTMRIGGGTTTTDHAAVFPFELPVLEAGEVISDASFSAYLVSIANAPSGDLDLYGLGYRSTSAVNPSGDYFEGPFGTDSSSDALDNAFATVASSEGSLLTTDSTGVSNLVDYLNAQYTAGAVGGDFVFLRLNPSVVDEGSYNYWTFSSANASVSSERPVLALEISGGSSADVTAPSVPSGLSASNITESSVDLSWSGSTDNVGVTGYLVYTDGANPVSVSGTNTTISGLSANTTYSFMVSAFDGAGNQSTQSSSLSVTTEVVSGGGAGSTKPTAVASFGPNGTHWPDVIDTPYMYDYTVTHLIDVDCSWSAISTAIASITSTEAGQGVLIRVAPGTLTGNGAGSSSTPVLQNLGSSSWSKRITVAPRDGWGTVVITGGARIFNVQSICFAGFDVDSLAFHANHRSALAWVRIGSFFSANGSTGYTINDLEIVELVMPNLKVAESDQMDSFSAGSSQIDGFTMVGCYIAPCYHPIGSTHHTDSLQFEPTGSGSDHTNVLLQDCAFYASNNAAVQVNGIGSMVVDHCYLAGGAVSQTRYPIPSNGDTAGTTSCFNGSGINMEAYDSYVVGGGFTGSGQQWSHAENTRISGSTGNNPTTGAWIVDPTLSATNPAMPPEPTTAYLESIWLP